MPRRTDARFVAAVRQLRGQRGLSLRAAAYKTGLGESVSKWLALAGYNTVPGTDRRTCSDHAKQSQQPTGVRTNNLGSSTAT